MKTTKKEIVKQLNEKSKNTGFENIVSKTYFENRIKEFCNDYYNGNYNNMALWMNDESIEYEDRQDQVLDYVFDGKRNV